MQRPGETEEGYIMWQGYERSQISNTGDGAHIQQNRGYEGKLLKQQATTVETLRWTIPNKTDIHKMPMNILMVNSIQGSLNSSLAIHALHGTLWPAETEVFLRFPIDLFLFELWGVLASESFDALFTGLGMWLTFATGVQLTDFRPLELINGAFLLVTNAWKLIQHV